MFSWDPGQKQFSNSRQNFKLSNMFSVGTIIIMPESFHKGCITTGSGHHIIVQLKRGGIQSMPVSIMANDEHSEISVYITMTVEQQSFICIAIQVFPVTVLLPPWVWSSYVRGIQSKRNFLIWAATASFNILQCVMIFDLLISKEMDISSQTASNFVEQGLRLPSWSSCAFQMRYVLLKPVNKNCISTIVVIHVTVQLKSGDLTMLDS